MLKDKEPTEFGWYVQRKMAEHNPPLNQTELALRTGVSQSTVSRWIYSPGKPDTGKLELLADVLGVDHGDLLVAAGHGRPAETDAAATRPVHRLARELDVLLSPESPLPDAEREELERSIDRWLGTFRPASKRRRSA